MIKKPLQTELHRHLDVSVRTATLHEVVQARGLVPQSTSLTAFRGEVILDQPLTSLRAVLRTFELFQEIYHSPEICERVAFETVEDCYVEGTRQVELRYSPSFVSGRTHLDWKTALAGFQTGLARARKRYPDLKASLLCIASRDFGTDLVDQTVEFYLANRHAFVGLDLAGNEIGFPASLFASSFKRAIAAGAKVTVHAGEASGPDTIWEAIETLGARRIGHGISAISDPKLQIYLREKDVCLEVCPTSNWITQCVKTLAQHPLPLLHPAGVPVCVNTDDPGVFPVTLQSELALCKAKLGMTDEELFAMMQNANRATFMNDP